MITKFELRNKAKSIRNSLDMKRISSEIVSKIKSSEIYINSLHIMIFYPLTSEVDLLPLLEDKTKFFYLPRVNEYELDVCPYFLDTPLNLSNLKIKEPLTKPVSKDIIDLVFVPALCVDENCSRLGYGKGFYDRFLKNFKGKSIIPIPQELVFSQICTDENDVCCSGIITQKKASFERG